MDTNRLFDILRDTTTQLRKGSAVTTSSVAAEVYAMPAASEVFDPNIAKVDCHFIMIGVDKSKAALHREELVTLLKAYPHPDRLAGGPSYIEVGGEIGDQGAAFQLFALGQVLGLWRVITPAVLGIKGPEADELAGGGMVMISGFAA